MISVIVPAYNEEKKIATTLKRLREVHKGEIIVVDDGSTDRTAKIAARYAKVIRHRVNRGKGAAMRTGAKAAKGDILVFMDAYQFDPGEIAKFVEALKETDMVIGVRSRRKMPPQRKITNVLSMIALWIACGRLFRDALSGFRAIRRSAWKRLRLRENRYAIEPEMNLQAVRKGLRIAEVDISVEYDGGSHLNIREGFYITVYLIKAVLRAV